MLFYHHSLLISLYARTDKQQEDLDLPYLTNQQDSSIRDSQQQLAANHQLATSQSHTSLTQQQQQLSNKQFSAADKQRHLDSGTVANADLSTLSANLATSGPGLLATKGSQSSSVLSSVSLASGAQMKKQQTLAESELINKEQRQTSGERSSVPQLSEKSLDLQSSAKIEVNSGSIDEKTLEKTAASGETPDKHLDKTKEIPNQSIKIIHPDATIKAEQDALVLVARDPQIQTPKPQISELKRLLRHTNSLNQLPEFGVETENEEELSNLMDQIDVWGLNIFEVHTFSQQHSLTTVVYKIFKVSLVALK